MPASIQGLICCGRFNTRDNLIQGSVLRRMGNPLFHCNTGIRCDAVFDTEDEMLMLKRGLVYLIIKVTIKRVDISHKLNLITALFFNLTTDSHILGVNIQSYPVSLQALTWKSKYIICYHIIYIYNRKNCRHLQLKDNSAVHDLTQSFQAQCDIA